MNQILSGYTVEDRKSFVEFITLLHKDLLNNPAKWENKNLADFLDALGRYASDIEAYYYNNGINIDADKAQWQVFADIFKGATVYE
jgi:hypothetical protein